MLPKTSGKKQITKVALSWRFNISRHTGHKGISAHLDPRTDHDLALCSQRNLPAASGRPTKLMAISLTTKSILAIHVFSEHCSSSKLTLPQLQQLITTDDNNSGDPRNFSISLESLKPNKKDKTCLQVVHPHPAERVVVLAEAVVPDLVRTRPKVSVRELQNIRRSRQTRLHLAALKR